MKYVITISREYGSGGRFIGKLIAEKLGISFYDSELLTKASDLSGISKTCLENYDETKESAFSYAQGLYGMDMSLGQKVFLAQFDAIKKIANQESCVIVGRCADYVLKDNPNVVKIFICAPLEDKIERAVTYYKINPAKAASIIAKKNKKRRSYYNFYTDKDWGKPDSYDLCINSKNGIETAVEAICAYTKRRFNLE
ncbi:MAG: cytidylate kinase-like family protein [Roseburia sp.]|nr:cytidylate kinase-like family protein [Anaeroplasma bactoclasticum]MCM1197061.1 cytidylate kinase-like family protein [Roseburia sp.]MCM1557540.1 cytidylate kinase-like family protein [Anaeroplasma bactoclasticum]